jgi:uncharacterized coiled-coil protein SlyX
MAAVSQPGSRAGIITALVVFVVLFFIAAIFAVVKGVDDKEKEQKLDKLTKNYSEVVSQGDLSSEDMVQVKDARSSAEDKKENIFRFVLGQRNDLAKLVKGQAVDGGKAIEAANQTILDANKKLKDANVTVPGASLTGAIDALADAVANRQQQIAKLTDQLASEQKALAAKLGSYQKELEQVKLGLEAAKTEATASEQKSTAYRQNKDGQIAKLEKDLVDAIERGRKTAEDLNSQITAKTEELKTLQKDKDKLVEALSHYRPQNAGDSVIRRADGHITQLDRNDVLYIDLGLGKQISAGMTFQVYDRIEGVPKIVGQDNSGTDVLPAGKGSIEVVRVGSDASECRIIRRTPGMQMNVGDVIANLIYDPNVKLRFKVYGDFDIDQNGVATAQEGEIVKRLIVQWGGQLTEDVNIDTDFLVLGREPTLPTFSAERLKDDPIAQFEADKAAKAVAAYEEVRNKALDLRIPVLNQNRFLYLIGYFDQAKK